MLSYHNFTPQVTFQSTRIQGRRLKNLVRGSEEYGRASARAGRDGKIYVKILGDLVGRGGGFRANLACPAPIGEAPEALEVRL